MLLDAAGVDAAMGVRVGFVLQFVAVLHSAPDVVQAGSLADELVGGQDRRIKSMSTRGTHLLATLLGLLF